MFIEQLQKDSLLLQTSSQAHLRLKAFETFLKQGIPSTKLEAWKYTSLQHLQQKKFSYHLEPSNFHLPNLEKRCRLTFINGRFSEKHSDLSNIPRGVIFQAFSQSNEFESPLNISQKSEEAFENLNTAFFNDGAILRVKENTQVTEALEILCIQETPAPLAIYPKHQIIIEAGAQVHIKERYFGSHSEEYLLNSVTEIYLAENSQAHYYRSQEDEKSATHFSSVKVFQKRNSKFNAYGLFLGSALNRNFIQNQLSEEGSECNLKGLYLTEGKQHVDNYTLIDHAVPHCISNELYKGILEDESSSAFIGHVLVREKAIKTQSKQLNKNLLLSPKANVNSKPLLEIYNNDVKCNHGATIGKLDEKQLFYLRSRGLDSNEARSLLTFAFASDWLSEIKEESLYKEFRCRILSHFFPKDEKLGIT